MGGLRDAAEAGDGKEVVVLVDPVDGGLEGERVALGGDFAAVLPGCGGGVAPVNGVLLAGVALPTESGGVALIADDSGECAIPYSGRVLGRCGEGILR